MRGDCARVTQWRGTISMGKAEAQVSRISSTTGASTAAKTCAKGRAKDQTRGGSSLAAIWIRSRPGVLAGRQSAGPSGAPALPQPPVDLRYAPASLRLREGWEGKISE